MNYIKEFKFNDYIKSPKTKVLSIRINEELFEQFNQFKKEFKEQTGHDFYFTEVVETKIRNILESYEER